MSSFQVAHFTAVQQPEEVVVAAASQGAAHAGPEGMSSTPEGPKYWEKLLGQQHRDMQQAELKALGKGKRERKQASLLSLSWSTYIQLSSIMACVLLVVWE